MMALARAVGYGHSIRLDQDSFVWLFSGRRGGGKSVSMTFFILRAIVIYQYEGHIEL